MSKGWYVKVATQVVFDVDTNIGVLASCEREASQKAQEILCDWLDKDDYAAELEKVLPWEVDMGDTMWHRSGGSGGIDFDTMQALSITPDSDFDPDPEPEIGHFTLMEVAQCLNEAYYSTPEIHPLREYQQSHGVAEVRDRINAIALPCEMTYQAVRKMYGFDDAFDLEFCPKFLDKCVDDNFELRSKDIDVLAILWERS